MAGGGPNDILTTRHLVAKGSQTDIGRALADEAHSRFGWFPRRAATDFATGRPKARSA
ncbi:hypothetical protein [Actinoalloteichus hymeniacidonis]|uniref:hypothetical protein n=1 Tax=Actinoalloteichus hymeniacidonis TaxID=340345 RepID=UPI0012FBD99B|nr:hypothetical protein [Actinoalloteichus hymeniacidonis]MBB5908072.1 hypothetical protein [Actinoalloteichus hymeniacidonis]